MTMNILGIDFEEWYHPELIKNHVTNEQKIPKIFKGIDIILDLLNKHNISATFFVVGEILQHDPELIDKIISNDHEIAFHTMHHDRIDSPNFLNKFDDELKEFQKLTNNKSKGFRAPTFSLNEKSSLVIKMLEKYNYIYDSSIMPAKTSMYGNPNADKKPYKITSENLESNSENGKLWEFPLMVTKLLGKQIPAAGGFYLRTLPLYIIKNAIKNYENEHMPACFYVHSWELTPELMPRIALSTKNNFITYHNIEKTLPKLDKLLSNFNFTSFEKYIKNNL
jgi:polysaccharide deacetylase family protein (PEP-CTERM system associated)